MASANVSLPPMPKKPETRTVRGIEHTLVVLHITGRDRFGRPRTAEFIYDDESMNIEEGEEFVTAFVQTKCIAKKAS